MEEFFYEYQKNLVLILALTLTAVLGVSCAGKGTKKEETVKMTLTIENRTGEAVTDVSVKEKTGYTVADVRVSIRENALQYGFTVIPGIDLVPHDPGFFSDASLHPNDAGFDYYADNLIRELKMRSPELFES